MSWEWLKVECALNGVELPARHVAISVNGTGSPGPFDWGFAGEVGAQLNDEEWFWQPVGYPAAVFPMGPSADVGVDEVVRLALLYFAGAPLPTGGDASGKLALFGYSQGAIVVDRVWRNEVLNPAGRLHHRLNDIIAIVNFGDPMRAPGICNGNVRAGFPIPAPLDTYTTGGIAGPDCLTPAQTPAFLMSCNNDGDLYGAAPVGDTPWTKQTGVGHDETIVYNIVLNFNVDNVMAIAQEVVAALGEVITDPADLIGATLGVLLGKGIAIESHVVSLVEALVNGGMFVVSGAGPHGDYEKFVPAMVDFVHEAGRNAFALAAA